jgi:glycosyl transferase family 92
VSAYLSIAAVYLNEGRYLREWIEFHRLVGVERFFLYENRSDDDHLEVLAPYIESGVVVYRHWPWFPYQLQVFDDVIEHHREDSRWIAFIDLDEFLFSPTMRPVAEILRDYEQHAAVGVNCMTFGTSGHEVPPSGLVIENYLRRTDRDARNVIIKSIVDPSRTLHAGRTPHYFRLRNHERAVTERHEPIIGDETESVSCELLRINHYFTRSQQERDAKIANIRADNGRAKPDGSERDQTLNAVEDRTILGYLPALREALSAPVPAPSAGAKTST